MTPRDASGGERETPLHAGSRAAEMACDGRECAGVGEQTEMPAAVDHEGLASGAIARRWHERVSGGRLLLVSGPAAK